MGLTVGWRVRILFLCAGVVVFAASGRTAPATTSHLRVFVIAVRDFERNPKGESLYDAGVDQGIGAATAELVDFLSKQYSVTPIVLTAKDDTTSSALRQRLDDYFTGVTEYTVNLVFVMTHGIGAWNAAQSPTSSRLYLATADTTLGNYKGRSLKATELVDYFGGLRKGSSVFLFLDTCHSGALDTPTLQTELANAWKNSARMMIVSSSLAEQNSYNTRFTQALVSIWRRGGSPTACTHGRRQIAARINAEMAKFPLSPGLTQDVSVLFPYTDDFCLESFAAGWALLILSNPSDKPVIVSVVRSSDLNAATDDLRLEAHDVLPVRLPKEKYQLFVRPVDPNTTLPSTGTNLDLSAENAVRYQPLPVPNAGDEAGLPEVEQLARLGQRANVLSSSPQQRALLEAEVERALTVELNKQSARVERANGAMNAFTVERERLTQERQNAATAAAVAMEKETVERQRLQEILRLPVGIVVSAADIEAQQVVVNAAHATVDTDRAKVTDATARMQSLEAQTVSVLEAGRSAGEMRDKVRADLGGFVSSLSSRRAADDALRARRDGVRSRLAQFAPVSEAERGLIVDLDPDRQVSGMVDGLTSVLRPVSATVSVEVEAYSQAGLVAVSQRKVRQIVNALKERLPKLDVVGRGYGRTPPPPTGDVIRRDVLQIVVSGSFLSGQGGG